MQTDPSRQVLYVWGWRVWCRRFLSLIIYATAVLASLMVYESAQQLARQPGLRNLVQCAFAAALLGAWLLGAWVAWRAGQSRVTRIALSPDRALVVRTVNFTSRRIPLTTLGDVEYERSRPSTDGEVHVPLLTVEVRGGLPIEMDLRGQILDEQQFEAAFYYRATRPPATKRRRWKRG
jgi:hypothetical protein